MSDNHHDEHELHADHGHGHDDHGHDDHDDHGHAHGPDRYLVYPTSEDVQKKQSSGMAYLAFFVILLALLAIVKAYS